MSRWMRWVVLSLWVIAPCAVADTVKLANGDVLNGTVVEQTDEHVILDHPLLGRLTLPLDQVTAVLTAEQAETAETQAKQQATEQAKTELEKKEEGETADTATTDAAAAAGVPMPADTGVQIGPVSVFAGWDREFSLGINGASGNSENFNMRAALNFLYEDDHKRWAFDNAYYRSSDSGQTSENEFYSELLRDWLVPDEKHFYFATIRYDWDEFQDWDHRVSGALGVGYQFIEGARWDVLGRLGAGGNQTFGGVDDKFTPEGLAGINVKWKINGTQSLAFANTYYPDLTDVGEFRNLTKFEWVLKFSQSKDKDFALKLGMENEHQSNPGGEAKANDLKYYLALVWQF